MWPYVDLIEKRRDVSEGGECQRGESKGRKLAGSRQPSIRRSEGKTVLTAWWSVLLSAD
jgi:hypothetical protein